ncbi:MAG: glycosyltransferase family 39 protein [Candidatus Shapirobacteria bacterium]|nr:glycosyltransferase family 39 protein [Candidatus Shapirobacteria bacterium]
MKTKNWLALFLILILAIFLRFWQLGETPKGFYCDEASLGYSAYSIMETGKDEFGGSLPILFRSFGDFKTPIYIYLLIPIYKILGVNVWSTRLLSALAGIIGIWFSFWLVKNLSNKINLGLITALLLAISPWSIIFSRTSYETNLAFTFLIIALWSFYKFKENKKFLILTAIMAALAFLTYHSERVIIPLLFFLLFIKEKKIIFDKKNFKVLMIAVILGIVLILPTLNLMTTPGFLSRLNSLKINGFKEFLSLYTAYFSPRYLFGLGDANPRSSYPDLAPFLFWQLPFLITGITWLFKKTKNEEKGFKFLIILLMAISPIPAAMTRDPFYTIRSLPLLLPLIVLSAIGINKFLEKYRIVGKIILIGLVFWSIGKIYLSVFKFNDYFRGESWEIGVEEMIKNIEKENIPVIVDNSRGEIYSQILFFTKFDPKNYQENNFEVLESNYYTDMNRNKIKKIGNITVRGIVWKDDIVKNQLLVGDELSINEKQIKEHCLEKVFEVKGLDNKILFVGVKTNPELKKIKGNNGCF